MNFLKVLQLLDAPAHGFKVVTGEGFVQVFILFHINYCTCQWLNILQRYLMMCLSADILMSLIVNWTASTRIRTLFIDLFFFVFDIQDFSILFSIVKRITLLSKG